MMVNNKKNELSKQTQDSVVKNAFPKKTSINKTILIFLAGIIILTFIAYTPTLKNGLTNWDDPVYIAKNPLITSLSGDNIKKIFDTDNPVSLNYHPITILSLAIDYKLSGYNPKTFHITNLLFHLLNTALVFWFIFLLSNKKVQVAAIVALFFGIHPMHVESVAWVSERKDVLYVFFFMSALVAYYKYIDAVGKNKIGLYFFILILFLLSLLSKAMAVVLPIIFLLIDFYKARKFDKYLILEKMPFFAMSLLFGWLASHIQAEGAAVAKFENFTWLQHSAFALYGFVAYIYKFFIPTHLSSFYPYPNLVSGYLRLPTLFYVCPFIVLTLFILVFLSLKKNKILVFGFLFFFITIALVLQFVAIGQAIIADRYSYLSYIGLLFPIAMSYDWLQNQTDKKFGVYKKLSMFLLIACCIVSLYLSFERTKVWKNSETLWTDVINKSPNNKTYVNLWRYWAHKNEIDKGQELYNRVEKLTDPIEKAKQSEQLIPYLEKLFKIEPNQASVNFNLGTLYGRYKHNYDKAIYYLNNAMILNPSDINIYNNLGTAYGITKQYDKAIAVFEKGIEVVPNDIAALNNLSITYQNIGDTAKANYYAKKVLEIKNVKK
jgi:tetratricopeptide (TPR) repeat protein